MQTTTYLILNFWGQRVATVKAHSKRDAVATYSEGIKWLEENIFCVTETELKLIKKNINKITLCKH